MRQYIRLDDDGNVVERCLGGDSCPIQGGQEISVSNTLFFELERFRYVDGEFVETIPKVKTDVDRIAELEQLIADLASLQLEVLMGG